MFDKIICIMYVCNMVFQFIIVICTSVFAFIRLSSGFIQIKIWISELKSRVVVYLSYWYRWIGNSALKGMSVTRFADQVNLHYLIDIFPFE